MLAGLVSSNHFSKCLQIMQKTVSQIDLVPTVSLLLGLPVPFSSLGTIVLDLFSHCPWWPARGSKIKRVYHVVKALRLNANQVGRSLI